MTTSTLNVSIKPWSELLGDGVILKVKIMSLKREGLWSMAEEKIARADLTTNLLDLARRFGEAVATRQNLLYGDNHDPDECAKAAAQALEAMLEKLERDKVLTEATATT